MWCAPTFAGPEDVILIDEFGSFSIASGIRHFDVGRRSAIVGELPLQINPCSRHHFQKLRP